MNSLPVGILMFAGFIAFMVFKWHFRNPAQIAIFAIVPVVGILLNYVFTRRTIGRLKAMPAQAATSATSAIDFGVAGGTTRPSVVENVSTETNEALLHVPRPRPIRMAKRGKTNIAVGVFVALVFAMIPALYLRQALTRTSLSAFGGKEGLMVGLMCLLLLIPYGIWRSQVKECALLKDGEIAMAHITAQSSSNQNSSSVFYEFTDMRGQSHQSGGIDYTQKLFTGMSVPVFYDVDNPKRNIAYCSTLHEVVSR